MDVGESRTLLDFGLLHVLVNVNFDFYKITADYSKGWAVGGAISGSSLLPLVGSCLRV